MNVHKLQIGFFIVLISIISILTFFVFKPFLVILFIALVIAIIFNPFYRKIVSFLGGRKSIASFITVLLVCILILLPLVFISFLLFEESVSLYEQVSQSSGESVMSTVTLKMDAFIDRFVPGISLEVSELIDTKQYADQILGWAVDNFGSIFSSIFKAFLLTFLLILGLFYFFRDGDRFIDTAKKLSPLVDTYDEQIFHKISTAVNSVIRGHLVIAIIQGILTGIGLSLFGVPSPVIWGFIAAIASFIPSIGTAFVTVPAILYLFLIGQTPQAIGMFIWAIVLVGMIDNLLGPILMERGIKIHPFIILISVLGGIQFFGIIGFIAGPVLLAFLFALLDIYPALLHKAIHTSEEHSHV